MIFLSQYGSHHPIQVVATRYVLRWHTYQGLTANLYMAA